jgi:mRNA interferase MazF
MKRLTVAFSYQCGDVVVVPFPFTDKQATKRRPATVLSSNKNFSCGHSILAMITSAGNASWPLDTPITDTEKAGLQAASVIRMKLFTLDDRLILRRIGRLSAPDRSQLTKSLSLVLHELNLRTTP